MSGSSVQELSGTNANGILKNYEECTKSVPSMHFLIPRSGLAFFKISGRTHSTFLCGIYSKDALNTCLSFHENPPDLVTTPWDSST